MAMGQLEVVVTRDASSLASQRRRLGYIAASALLMAAVVLVALSSHSSQSSLAENALDTATDIHQKWSAAKIQRRLVATQRAQTIFNQQYDRQIKHLRQDVDHLLSRKPATGPAGPPGPAGPQGATGAPGPAGPAGKVVIQTHNKAPAPAPQKKEKGIASCLALKHQRDKDESFAATFLSKMMCRIDTLLGPQKTELDLEGYDQHGGFMIHKVVDQDFYYLDIHGTPNHKLTVVLHGSLGYKKTLHGFGEVYSGPIHIGAVGSKTYIECRDKVTGEVQWFRFQF